MFAASPLLFALLPACAPADDEPAKPADDGCTPAWHYPDADGDGYGDADAGVEACDAPDGWVSDGGDCDDADDAVFPGAVEACDGVDDDCDGVADEVATWYSDADGDGYGDPATGVETCAPAGDQVPDGTDCVDQDAAVHPGATETCDGVDQDCDGAIDDGLDADGDGHLPLSCPGGDDCDDADATVLPGGDDACDDGIDGDCDGFDPTCSLDGEVNLVDADAKVYSDLPNYEAARFLDVGDVDGDGIGDVLASTLGADGMYYGGGGYVVYGPITGTHTFADVGVRITGTSVAGGGGRSVGLGDVDGDGFDDVGLGAPYGTEPGLYVLRGPLLADVALEDAETALLGVAGTYAGHGSDIADVNGDGIADGLVGAYLTESGAGTVYVKYGPLAGDVDLTTDADATLVGEAPRYYAGRVMRAGEDMDGDGIGDLLLPAPYASAGGPDAGLVYVVYGPPPSDLDLAGADARLIGETPHAVSGQVVGMGDVDGDGLADALVGSSDSTAGNGAGAAYVVYGPAYGDVALSGADIILRGNGAGEYAGADIDTADFDEDGRGDVLVGAIGDGSWSGTAYVFLAAAPGTYAMADADVWFTAEDAGDYAGQEHTVGDVDGDGHVEAVIGAPYEETGGTHAGAFYVAGWTF